MLIKQLKSYSVQLISAWCICACQPSQEQNTTVSTPADTSTKTIAIEKPDSSAESPSGQKVVLMNEAELNSLPDSAFVELLAVDSSFVLDMKYATADNFLKSKVYDCDKCLLRVNVARALAQAQKAFLGLGYRIKLFDCYRPLDVQKRMWAIMPDDKYVGNPYKNGSVHNKGAAVDLTLVNASGEELDMGTSFDYFGKEAHHAFTDLSEEVRNNRRLLKQGMDAAGFQPITSEWWHYFYKNNSYPVANFKPSCE